MAKQSRVEARVASLRSENEKRERIARNADNKLQGIFDALCENIRRSFAEVQHTKNSVMLTKGKLELTIDPPDGFREGAFGASGWDVVAGAKLRLIQIAPRYSRSSSLWYASVPSEECHRWREVAYRFNPVVGRRAKDNPFAVDNLEEADIAMAPGMVHPVQVAFGPVCIDHEDVEAFIDRWTDLFAKAVAGVLPAGQSSVTAFNH